MNMKLVRFLLLLFPAGASAATAETVPPAVRIGVVGSALVKGTGTSNAAVTAARNGFARVGVPVKLVYFSGTGPAINEALAQGNIDFGEYGGLPNVIGLAGGVPARLVLVRHASNAYFILVKPQSPVKSVKDLRGRRIAVQLGTLPHELLVHTLTTNALPPGTVQIVNLQSAEGAAALNAGAVDAIFGTINQLALRDEGQARVIATTRGQKPVDFDVGGFLVSRTFEQRYPGTVQKVVTALVENSAWSGRPENRDALVAIYARTGLPGRYYAEDLVGAGAQRFSPLIDPAAAAGYQQANRFALENRLIRRSASFRGWANPHYVNTAINQLHLNGLWKPENPIGAR
jgi:sulfonate transport system substrate-binding protein